MSNPFGSEAELLIAEYSSAIQSRWLQFAAVALLTHEYAITFSQEVALFWNTKRTGATVLFMGTRYIALLSYNFVGAVTFAPMSDQSCATLQKAQFVISICQYIFWAAFSALRTLALSGMNWPLATIVFVLALAPFAVNFWPVVLNIISGANIPLLGCGSVSGLTAQHALIGVIVSRTCLIASDMIVVVVTWLTWKRSTRDTMVGVVPSLSYILMYNGTLYFLVVVVCNALHMALTVIAITAPFVQTSEVTALTDPITAILICRFLLALQYANQATLGRNTLSLGSPGADDDIRGHDTLRFASVVIGSIGESLTTTGRELDTDESDTLEGAAADGLLVEMEERRSSTGCGTSQDSPGLRKEYGAVMEGHAMPHSPAVSGSSSRSITMY